MKTQTTEPHNSRNKAVIRQYFFSMQISFLITGISSKITSNSRSKNKTTEQWHRRELVSLRNAFKKALLMSVDRSNDEIMDLQFF